MKHIKISESQKQALNFATVAAVVLGFFFLRYYFGLAIVAIILAYLFNPIYRRFNEKYSQNTAAAITLIISVLAVVIPLTLVILLAIGQLTAIGNSIANTVAQLNVDNIGDDAVDAINKLLNAIPFIDVTVSQASITETVTKVLVSVGQFMLDYLTSMIKSIPALFTTAITFVFVFFSLIKNGPLLLDIIRQLNPLGGEMTNLYIKKVGAMIQGTVRGQFVIAACQGLFTAVTFALIGYPELAFIMFLIATVLSIIPLGAGILLIPLGVLMILFGNVTDGLIIILEHLLINTNVDNILRPRLVSKEARLDSALMLVSVFAGMSYFGFLGIVIGPTIMIIIVTTVQVYLEVQKGFRPVSEIDTRTSVFKRISNFSDKILNKE